MFCLKLRESMVCGTEKNPVPADHAFFAVALYIMNIMSGTFFIAKLPDPAVPTAGDVLIR